MSEQFDRAIGDVCSPYAAFRPPNRVSISESAARNLVISQPGGTTGPWSPDETPYMVEPMDMLRSRRHEAVVFTGPARTGKTMGLLLGWMAQAVVDDPGDMLMIQMTQDKAREFSKTDVDRAIKHSPNLQAMKSANASHDNTHDKMFRHGMWLRIAWPTASNVSGSTYRYVAITDLDRISNSENVDGEGPLFKLALKRTTTFLSRGMCLVESSPGRPIIDPKWRAAMPHEAPPCEGVLSIYNQSDRRRWYWHCPDCRDPFEAAPGLGLFHLPSDDELIEVVREADLEQLADQYNRVLCPHCGSIIPPKLKRLMNANGRWVAEGQTLTADGDLLGDPMRSTIAGYWLGGVAAAYQSWKSLIMRHLQGLREYSLTGSEETLKTTVNTDQGMPYMSRHLAEGANQAGDPASRKAEMPRFIVPDWTRVILASVDVQGGSTARFVVQVEAVGEHMESAIIDRYNITESERDGMGGKAPIDPAAYGEDWDVLTQRVLKATYRTSREGLEMRVKMAVVDTGGEDGVTERAYAWFRRLRRAGLSQRVMLIKGASAKGAPIIRESMVGGKGAKDTQDIPLYLLNPNLLKDAVAAGLKRPTPGPGYYHFPDWLPKAFFDELQAEVREPNGTWKQIRKRNEAFDLCAYVYAGLLRLGYDKVKWISPPPWLQPIFSESGEPSKHPDLMSREERQEMKAPVARPQRRVIPSTYVA